MPYNPSSDFVGLWSAVSGGVQKAQMPGLDFVIQALGRAGLLRISTSATAPITNQTTTAWFRPSNPSFQSEGTLFLWDVSLNMYVPATPELFHAMISGGSDPSTGGGGGDGTGIPEAPNDGVQYGRQSLAWTPVAGSAVIPPGTGVDDMAIISGTAPASPAVGQQWWDGSKMQVWDGAQWQLVGPPVGPSGGALETTTLEFALTQSGDLVLGSANWEIVNLTATPLINAIPASWDPVTKKYTPKKAGYYAFNVRARTDITSGFSAGVAILKNDDGNFDNAAADTILGIASQTGIAYAWQSATGFAQMNGTTDYVRYFAYVNTASRKLLDAGSNPVFTALRMP